VLQGDALRLTDRDGADAVVEGRLVALRPAALAFPTGLEPGEITVGEYRVSVALDVRVVRRDDGAVLFHEPKLQGVEEYLAGSEPIATADRRREALGRLAARMMADLHDLMLQGF